MINLRPVDGIVHNYTSQGWTEFKKWLDGTYGRLKFVYEDQGTSYEIITIDDKVYRTLSINKTDASDFETNFKSKANAPVGYGDFDDPRLIRRLGNLTATSGSEVLLATRTYTEPASEAQRFVVSTSVQDASGGSGAKKVRIHYLTSAYALKTEDVTLNGTTEVATVGTDIRFIEKLQVIEGSSAVGAVKILSTSGGSEICGIGSGTYDAFLCHHYVPAGKSGWVYMWRLTSDDEVKVKLMGRATYGSAVVDEHWDLVNMMGIATPPGLVQMEKRCTAMPFGEKAYIRLNVVPNQATSTTIRGELLLWEN